MGAFMGHDKSSISDIIKLLKKLQHDLLDLAVDGGPSIEVGGEIARRRRRERIFPSGYFADVAWELLTDLYEAHQHHQQISVTMLGLHGGVPLTTTLRYLDRMVADGFVERTPDKTDRRRIHVQLTERGIKAMDDVFRQPAEPTRLHRAH